MIFEALNEAAERGELLLVDGGFCHWHLRRDGQLTIREIIVLPERQRQGVGTAMLETLKRVPCACCIVALCPADLPANRWYERMGFVSPETRGGRARPVNVWRLDL